ncbi:hypothetical protein L1987_13908 [Smallanthus sonchifolius]|uniref:Uncharacterized protein n=1 Tax=Smallanthus sonchifolius TaxID=185202 RepID=A0ACB9JIU7_9ASTR|nr:hypothetical protein L1987_13908 [Smallanthus sonchifolius]
MLERIGFNRKGIATIKPKKEALLIAAAEEDEEQKKERILELSINPSYPDQKVKISGNLSPVTVNRLKDLLEESKDVFTRCPVDMVGVPRDIVEHSLNISPSFKFKCFLDAYKGYHQIHMKNEDEEKMAFHTAKGETFDNLRSISMKLNPGKCSFGFEEGKFLGHIMGKQSIKANPNKVQEVMEMRSPRTKKASSRG